MVVYVLTESQRNELDGKRYRHNSYFNPVEDANGNWVISCEEVELGKRFYPWLDELEEIDYQPKQPIQ